MVCLVLHQVELKTCCELNGIVLRREPLLPPALQVHKSFYKFFSLTDPASGSVCNLFLSLDVKIAEVNIENK